MTKKSPLLGILMAFLIPLGASMALLHYDVIGTPTHHGRLLSDQPAWPELAKIRSGWHMFYIPQKTLCQGQCWKDLDSLAKIKVLLGKNSDKVDIIYTLTNPEDAPRQNPYLRQVSIKQLHERLASYQLNDDIPHFFIADPMGRLVLHYSGKQVPKEMMSDLNKLLKSSRALNT